MMRGLIAALAALLIPAAAAGQDPTRSLRIATYNAYLLSPAFQCPNAIAPDCVLQTRDKSSAWARRLVATILADSGSIDVIAINEAWDEDAKRVLAEGLAGVYPVQVRKIDAPLVALQAQAVAGLPGNLVAQLPVGFAGEDSGLMLFAKRDFTIVPLPANGDLWGDDPTEIVDADGPVAFTRFVDCALPDCLAAKGAALVRLRQSGSGWVYNVVLTHMQADNFESGTFNPGVRARQFAQIRRLILNTLPSLQERLTGPETVFLLGDLNVPRLKNRTSEFGHLFTRPGSFFESPLYESWETTSSPAELTETNSIDHERLDYILASPTPRTYGRLAPRRLCVQHLTVPRRYRDLESDHNLVLADVNALAPYCNPASARVIDMPGRGGEAVIVDSAAGNPGLDATRIRTPGAMQWFYVDNRVGGTFSVGADNSNLALDVYLPEDLTTPRSRYNAGSRLPSIYRGYTADLYTLPGSFYVRVRGNARSTIGNYSLLIRRHSCAREDPCLLSPGVLVQAKLSKAGLAAGETAQNEAWFRYDAAGAAASGLPQLVTLKAEMGDFGRLRATIVGHSDPNGLSPPAAAGVGSFSGPMTTGASGYLVIRQHRPAATDSPVAARMDSNLKYLTVRNLVCKDETNPEAGSDDIYTRFTIDGRIQRVPASGFVEFDCDDSADTHPWDPAPNPIGFVEGVSVVVREEDDSSADDSSQARSPPPLADGVLSADGELVWKFDGGEYRLPYTLGIDLNAPRSPFQ